MRWESGVRIGDFRDALLCSGFLDVDSAGFSPQQIFENWRSQGGA